MVQTTFISISQLHPPRPLLICAGVALHEYFHGRHTQKRTKPDTNRILFPPITGNMLKVWIKNLMIEWNSV